MTIGRLGSCFAPPLFVCVCVVPTYLPTSLPLCVCVCVCNVQSFRPPLLFVSHSGFIRDLIGN